MSRFQQFKGNPEVKQLFLVDQLIGGINTEFSDDNSQDNEFRNLVNFEMDTRGSLNKRSGFGKLGAISEILNKFERIPDVKLSTPENPRPDMTNDNLVYMKLIKNDRNVFNVLSTLSGEQSYRSYQRLYGTTENPASFEILAISTSYHTNKSTAWLYSVTLPALNYDEEGNELPDETIVLNSEIYDLPVLFSWDRNLRNIDTIEFFDKIYFTSNDKALVVFDRNDNTFKYHGKDIPDVTNTSYKPNAMEIRKVGFNLLGDDPLHWVDFQGLTTESIQGMYIMTMDNIPTQVVPNGGKFRINVLYTGADNGFTFEFKEGESSLSVTSTLNSDLSQSGLKVYDIVIKEVPTTEVEIKITKTGSTVEPYYDYYSIGTVDPESKSVQTLNVGECAFLEMYNRAVYYKGDTIFFSELNHFDYIPNYNYVSLPIEPTDRITKIVYFRNVYIIFTKYMIYKMIGQFGTTDFQVMPVNPSVGCHAPNTVVHIENELYFASTRGLYSLRSNEFRDGIENLRELDEKFKSLTRESSLYLGKVNDPSTKSIAISEKAYAMRYKDKYMLFYNKMYDENIELNEETDDVLVYKYEMKACTLYRFAVRPTFLFEVDNSIITFATIPEKEEYTEDNIVFHYDFTEGTSNNIEDLSDNQLDGTLVGGYLQPGYGVKSDSSEEYVKIANIPDGVGVDKGFSIEIDTKCDFLRDNSTVFDLGQLLASSSAGPTTGSIFTSWSNGYRGELAFSTTPDINTKRSLVNYTVKLHRDSTSRNATQSGSFNLKEGSNSLIANTNFDFNFGSKLNTIVRTGSFIINHDGSGNYSKNWTLSLSTKYPTHSTRYDKGPTQYFDIRRSGYWDASFGIRFVGRAEAYDWGCRLYIRPYLSLLRYASIYVGARTLYTWTNGQQRSHTMPAVSHNGSAATDIACGEQIVDIYYSGQPSIPIDGQLNIRATINSVYRENLDVDAFNFTLPYVNPYTVTTWNNITMSGTQTVKLDQIADSSKREIYLLFNTNGSLKIGANSEYAKGSLTVSNIVDQQRHKWKFNFTKQTSDFKIDVYKDDVVVGTGVIPLLAVRNGLRDSCLLFRTNTSNNSFMGEIYSFRWTDNSKKDIVYYDFENGRGSGVTDKSGNNRNGTIQGAKWLVENGLKFSGGEGYVIVPEIYATHPFSNGFIVEFEAKITDLTQISKIVDLATAYGSGDSSNQKCSINVSIDAKTSTIHFMSTSVSFKTYKISKTGADLLGRHVWRLSCTDNGLGHTMSIICDDEVLATSDFNYGGITNISRKSNFIGRSNNPKDNYFKGMLYYVKVITKASINPVPIYAASMYEFDRSYTDFERPMYLEIESKAINMNYPLHEKKLKNIFIKGLGGYSYVDFLCNIKADGHIINNPYEYECYIDANTQQIVYNYVENRELELNEKLSILGNMRLDYTKLGETTYETRKLVARGKGMNYSVKIQGESGDPIKIESFGYVFKLGKVKER